MKKEDCFELGIISRLYSFKGEVILFIDSDQPEKYYNLDSLFLEINKQLTPFFITKSSVNKAKELRIRFEGVDTEEQASRILKKKAYLPIEVLPELDNKHFYYHEIEGFELVDSEKGNIGSIITVLDNPGNMLSRGKYQRDRSVDSIKRSYLYKSRQRQKTVFRYYSRRAFGYI